MLRRCRSEGSTSKAAGDDPAGDASARDVAQPSRLVGSACVDARGWTDKAEDDLRMGNMGSMDPLMMMARL